MASPQKLIIDTDPGQDDAVAILLALASPEIDLLGITTVAGNVPLVVSRGAGVDVVGVDGASTGEWLCFTGMGAFAGAAKCDFNGFHGAVEVEELKRE